MSRERFRHERTVGKAGATLQDLSLILAQMIIEGVPNDARVASLNVGTFGMSLEVKWSSVVEDDEQAATTDSAEPTDEEKLNSAADQFVHEAFDGLATGVSLTVGEMYDRTGWKNSTKDRTDLLYYAQWLARRGYLVDARERDLDGRPRFRRGARKDDA